MEDLLEIFIAGVSFIFLAGLLILCFLIIPAAFVQMSLGYSFHQALVTIVLIGLSVFTVGYIVRLMRERIENE